VFAWGAVVAAGVTLASVGGAAAPLLAAPGSDPVLRVRVTGKGSVTSEPKGTIGPVKIMCPKRCSANYPVNARIRLYAYPAAGWRFSGWAGGCAGTRECLTKIVDTTVVRASFVRKSA
jgi:hypothetical protein